MEGEFFEISPSENVPLRDNYPYFGDGTGRSEPITIRNIKIRSDSDAVDPDDLPKKDTMRRSPLFTQPKGTLKYDVKGNDTLNSIALQFESTPTQLMRLNHLSSRMLYPGQTLYVPDPDSPEPPCLSPSSATKKSFDLPMVSQHPDVPKVSSKAKRFLLKSKSKEEKSTRKRGPKTLLRYDTEPRPGRVIRERSQEDDAEESKNFLKLNVKYITDGEGVVSGTMLVTPNAIMFDPNVLDPLVKERGTSPYGVITQMDSVTGAAMYHDISAMSLKTAIDSAKTDTCPNCPVYVPSSAAKNTGTETSPTTANPASASGEEKTDPEKDVTNPSMLRMISQQSDGFVVVEKSKEPTSPTGDITPCSVIPEEHEKEVGSLCKSSAPDRTEGLDAKDDLKMPDGGTDDTAPTAGPVVDDTNKLEGSGNGSVEGSVAQGSDPAPDINGEAKGEEMLLEDDLKETQNDDTLESPVDEDVELNVYERMDPDTEIADETTHLLASPDDSAESDSQMTPTDTKGSLPDLIESAEQSVKDKEAPSGSTPGAFILDPSCKPSDDHTSCQYCSADLTNKVTMRNSSNSHIPTKPQDETQDETQGQTQDETQDANSTSGFVNFSSGIFVRECNHCADVPDITESLQDTSATERELETIQAEGREIRRHSDLLSELPAESHINHHHLKDKKDILYRTQSLDETRLKKTDVNKEVILGYNKTNFEEYLPKPAQRYEDPPLYLCLRVGKPMVKTFPGSKAGGKEGSSKKNHKAPEYWFAIPREKADNLYAFFLQWSPDVYGKEGSSDDVGFVAVDEELDSSLEVIEDFFEEPIGKDWEIITKEEANRRRMTILECEMNLPLPELEGATSILLEPEHVRKLTKQLPARTEGYSWKNIYNTAEHGYSLRNLYRSMTGIDSPVLLVIRDSTGMIFGALTPCPVKVSEHYYGTGETFLYNFVDWELNVFRWTGENNFFIKGNYNSLTLGGGDGAFGLWLDGDLYRGRSRSCKTFSNPCIAHDEDFIIADVEAWGFGLC